MNNKFLNNLPKINNQDLLSFRELSGKRFIHRGTGETKISRKTGDDLFIEVFDAGDDNKILLNENFSGRIKVRFHGSGNIIFISSEANHLNHLAVTFWCNDSIFRFGEKCTSNGMHCVIGNDASLVDIKEDCMISSGVWLYTHDQHAIIDITQKTQLNPPHKGIHMTIGPHAWLGQDCMIIKASNIGRNSIIGARSLVDADVLPNCIYAGSPARMIKTGITWSRHHFVDKNQIERLLEEAKNDQ